MTLLSPDQILIGNDAGWLLEFELETARTPQGVETEIPLILSSDQYHAKINARLPHGLEGGAYTFTIDGLLDEHYRQLKAIERNPDSFFGLYLFWRDTNTRFSSYLASLVGLTGLTHRLGHAPENALVAILKITGVSRKAGDRYYQTTIEAKERVFCALSQRIPNSLKKDTHQALLEQVGEQTRIEIRTDGLENGMLPSREDSPQSRPAFEAGSTYIEKLKDLAKAMEETTGKHGRGMLLIRNGVLHFGTRSDLMGTRNLKQLSLQNGLVESQMIGLVETDPYFNPQTNPFEPPKSKQFSLTLKGRPDIKPGDFVQFVPPPDDLLETTPSFGSAMAGTFQAPIVPDLTADFQNAVTMYVSSVNHKLGKNHGFVTTVAGVEANPNDPWDHHSPRGSRPRAAAQSKQPVTNRADEAAQAIQQNIQTALERLHLTEVGEVRGIQTSGAGSETEFPGQTLLKVFEGLEATDSPPDNQAHRLSIQRESPLIREGVAYASPFAWGKCGLVLPRYPGTRIVMTHRNGQRHDPIDIGALWEAGHGPDSEPGDWWLILPVDVPPERRATIEDSSEPPEEHTGPVTQDLIDAEGNRIIEVGELTIRITRDSLKNASDDELRPARPEEADAVTIEHVDAGSKIVMKSDGTVVIEAKNIELKAEEDITMEARNVNVSVSQAMDVS